MLKEVGHFKFRVKSHEQKYSKNIKPYALIVGNPGKQIGWMSEYGHRLEFDDNGQATCKESGENYILKENNGETFVQKVN